MGAETGTAPGVGGCRRERRERRRGETIIQLSAAKAPSRSSGRIPVNGTTA
jgi:hypothetical protein